MIPYSVGVHNCNEFYHDNKDIYYYCKLINQNDLSAYAKQLACHLINLMRHLAITCGMFSPHLSIR